MLNNSIATDGSSAPRFYLFHRHREFNPSEGVWMGWERKRGKLANLVALLRGGSQSPFMKTGSEKYLETLKTVQYLLTLDSDTVPTAEAAANLVGTAAHIMN